jgi:hypothetical protein
VRLLVGLHGDEPQSPREVAEVRARPRPQLDDNRRQVAEELALERRELPVQIAVEGGLGADPVRVLPPAGTECCPSSTPFTVFPYIDMSES